MEVSLLGIVKRYGNVVAVKGIDLHVRDGEFVTILGPSGCGKTTVLRCMAGLERVDSGEIRIGGEIVSSPRKFVPPERRNVGMIFQSYAIWPHMTVFENVAYGLRIRRMPERVIKERVFEALALVDLVGYAERFATQLSGGQQQRVALARSIALQPDVLLFDEPLSNLDARLRERMRYELRELQKKLGITSIYVTHDQGEAMALADRIVVMNDGRIEQVGEPREVYLRPANAFVADFLGMTNFISGTVEERLANGLARVRADGTTVVAPVPDEVVPGTEVLLSVRPEQVQLFWEPPRDAGDNIWKAQLVSHSFLGHTVDVRALVGGNVWRVSVHPDDFEAGEGRSEAYLVCKPTRIAWMPGRGVGDKGKKQNDLVPSATLARET